MKIIYFDVRYYTLEVAAHPLLQIILSSKGSHWSTRVVNILLHRVHLVQRVINLSAVDDVIPGGLFGDEPQRSLSSSSLNNFLPQGLF